MMSQWATFFVFISTGRFPIVFFKLSDYYVNIMTNIRQYLLNSLYNIMLFKDDILSYVDKIKTAMFIGLNTKDSTNDTKNIKCLHKMFKNPLWCFKIFRFTKFWKENIDPFIWILVGKVAWSKLEQFLRWDPTIHNKVVSSQNCQIKKKYIRQQIVFYKASLCNLLWI